MKQTNRSTDSTDVWFINWIKVEADTVDRGKVVFISFYIQRTSFTLKVIDEYSLKVLKEFKKKKKEENIKMSMPFSIRTTLFLVKAFLKKYYNARELSELYI